MTNSEREAKLMIFKTGSDAAHNVVKRFDGTDSFIVPISVDEMLKIAKALSAAGDIIVDMEEQINHVEKLNRIIMDQNANK